MSVVGPRTQSFVSFAFLISLTGWDNVRVFKEDLKNYRLLPEVLIFDAHE
jgi:hypothetical protein